jgi:hypothetical protein
MTAASKKITSTWPAEPLIVAASHGPLPSIKPSISSNP